MNSFHVSILAAERSFYDGECQLLEVPTLDGAYGVLASHRNTISAIVPGKLRMKDAAGNEHVAAVSNGLLKIEENEVLVLVDTIERPEEIDERRAQRAADAAREALTQKKSQQDYLAAQAKLARALGRLQVKQSNRG